MRVSRFKQYSFYVFLFLCIWVAGFVWWTFISKGDALMLFARNRSEFRNDFFVIATLFGEGYVYFIAALVALAYRIRHAIMFVVTGILVALVAGSLKWFFAQPRPATVFYKIMDDITVVPDMYLNVGDTSFPSGHTMSGFAFWSIAAFVVRNKMLQVLFLFIALLVGVSRIYLFQHFLDDVLAGSFIGVCIAVILHSFVEYKFQDESAWYNKSVWSRTKSKDIT